MLTCQPTIQATAAYDGKQRFGPVGTHMHAVAVVGELASDAHVPCYYSVIDTGADEYGAAHSRGAF